MIYFGWKSKTEYMDEWGKLGQNSKIDNIQYFERERDALIKIKIIL